MEYEDCYALLQRDHPSMAEELAEVRTLESVMKWMEKHQLPLGTINIIPQDEYNLDFIIPLRERDQHLVFGIT